MSSDGSNLDKWKSIASIVSSLAIPIVLAVAGYFIQKQLAIDGLKKDYVQIAATILKESASNQEPELRQWAVVMLDANSPIPFSSKVKDSLNSVGYTITSQPVLPSPPEKCMKPPKYISAKDEIHSITRRVEGQPVDVLVKELMAFVDRSVERDLLSNLDKSSLECLQDYVRIVTDRYPTKLATKQ